MALHARVALVTGGAGLIGRETARLMATEGAAVGVVDRRAEALEVAQAIAATGGRSLGVVADLSLSAEAERAVNEVLAAFGRVDILANVAGNLLPGRPAPTTLAEMLADDELEGLLDANLRSCIFTTRAALPSMVERHYGKIVNVASIAVSAQPWLGVVHPLYAAAKGGVVAFTRALAVKVAPLGINVNCVAPGAIHPPGGGVGTLEAQARRLALIPRGRAGTAGDIAQAVLFLASDVSDFIVGHTLHANGGEYMA